VTPKPAPTPSAVARRPAPGRAAVVAQVRQGNASQPIGPPPVDLTPVAARTPAPVPAATPPPTPTPAPTGAPKVEDARFLSAAAPEEVVEDSQRGNTNFPVTVVVDVTVGTNGRASGVRLERSSGNQFVDRNALAAARASTYAPAKVDGKPSVSSYRAVYEFR
jgi:TonB family protein